MSSKLIKVSGGISGKVHTLLVFYPNKHLVLGIGVLVRKTAFFLRIFTEKSFHCVCVCVCVCVQQTKGVRGVR